SPRKKGGFVRCSETG
ncbi:hypothetical protein EC880221_0861, partial [Escherichia coli 88.0221]